MALLDFARSKRPFRGGEQTQFHPRVEADDEPIVMTTAELKRREQSRDRAVELVGRVRGLLDQVDTSDQLRRHGHNIVSQLEADPNNHHLVYEIELMYGGLLRTAVAQSSEAAAEAGQASSDRNLHQAALTYIVAAKFVGSDATGLLEGAFGKEVLDAEVNSIRARSALAQPPAAPGDLL